MPKGLLPNEYRKRSTVYVERLRGPAEPKRYGEDDLMTTDAYIVQTHRLDGQWTHTVEIRGEMWVLPGKVLDRVIAQREAVIKEGRSERGKRVQEKLRVRAAQDQQDAEAERSRDLQGL